MKTGSSKEYRSFIRKTLDLPEGETIRVEMLFQGGSERSFYRVRTGDHRSRVFMHYNPARKENGYYAAIAVFLDDIGVRVPRLIEHDPARCFILMEDLGDTELLSLQRAPWEQRKNLYRKTLELALKLHAFPLKDFPFRTVSLTEAFGPALYKWERDYFRENFVEGICGIKLESHESEALERELAALAERLDGDGRSLVHRDLQSKNVLISGQEPALIDFQGMRIGNPFYDLGSLLYDPYVSFTDAERSELLSLYRQSSDQFPDRDAFQAAFLLASSQRLMQALGAYAFLGLKRGLRGFLEHIPRGLENLIDASTRAGNLPLLRELAIKCRKVVSSLRFQVERV